MASQACEQEAPPSIWAFLEEWAEQLEAWQQYLLGAAVRNRTLSEEHLAAAYAYFLQCNELSEVEANDLPAIEVIEPRPTEPLGEPLKLDRVEEVTGVNAIPAGAALTFGPTLTLVYGRNGAGKSGFVRLLANACFCRYRPEILGNIYSDNSPEPSATFRLRTGGQALDPVQFKVGDTVALLRRFAVFDTAVARHHISQPTSFEFKPSGFDVFGEMVRAYHELSGKLDADIACKFRPNTFGNAYLGGETPVLAAIRALGPQTNVDELRALGRFGADEAARLEEVDALLLALRSKSPKQALQGLREAKADLQVLREQLAALFAKFSPADVETRKQMIDAAVGALATAELLSSEWFKRPYFHAVGSPAWETFVTAAHALARTEGPEYPQPDDRCLLCEQALHDDARKHLAALFEFVEGDARKAADRARATLRQASGELSALDLNPFGETSRVRGHVRRLAPDLERSLLEAFGQLRISQGLAIASIEGLASTEQAIVATGYLEAIDQQLAQSDADVAALTGDETDEAIAKLDAERLQLRHREVLSQQLEEVEAHLAEAAWVSRAARAKPKLAQRSVTDKEKDAFKLIVGEGYRQRFNAECEGLDCGVPIELQTMGRDGSTVRTMALRGGYKPPAILSEGEQRAIAIADFLAEVSANPAVAGVILDDPVNSQDHQRMRRIASRLVQEATERQVVVFTHDLPFLNAMFLSAEASGLEVQAHWVDRDGSGRPGCVVLGDAPVTMKAYDTTAKAEAALAEAKDLAGSKQVDQVRIGLGALRRTLEEAVVKRVFKDVVPRWTDQVRVTALKRVNWDNEQAEKLSDLYEDLSRLIEGHSHTDEAMGAPPTVDDLKARIDEVNALLKWARADRPKPQPTSSA